MTADSEFANLTIYGNLTQKDRLLFKKALREETNVSYSQELERYKNTTDLSDSEMESFIPGPGLFGRRYIIYKRGIYKCVNISNIGAA
jgi:hypothetical protein